MYSRLALLLVACTPHLNDAGYRPGDRLRPLGFRAEDGTTLVRGIRDRDLGPCELVRRLDGSFVCAPVETAVFRDAQCQSPVYIQRGCSDTPPPSHVSVLVEQERICGERVRTALELEVRPVGAAVEVDRDALYVRGPNDTCTATRFAEGRGFAVGDPISDTRLVHARLESAPRGPLRIDYFAADDGSQWLLHARDDTFGPCNFMRHDGDGPDDVRCSPRSAAELTTLFSDATCTSHAARVLSARLECVPTLVERVTPVSCGEIPTISYFRRGDALVAPFGIGNDGCVRYGSVPADSTYFELGDPVDASRFAPARLFNRGGRLALRQVVTAEGETLATGDFFFDRELSIACVEARFADGRLLCRPLGARTSVAFTSFADTECTEPLYLDFSDSVCDPTKAFVFESDLGAATCGLSSVPVTIISRLHALGDAWFDDVYVRLPTGECKRSERLGSYYRVGEDLTASLAELEAAE